MAPDAKPRDVQHGIEEITRRLDEGRPGADRWAKLLVDASRRAEDPVRTMAAWAMHFDAGRPEFVERLRDVVTSDPSEVVRRNAAMSLAKSGDAAARPVLRSMLEPFTVAAPEDGVVVSVPPLDAAIRETKPAGRIRTAAGDEIDVVAPVPGRVVKRAGEGSRLAKGAPLVVLGPDPEHAFNAVQALRIVGTKEDLELLGLASAPQSQFPDEVKAAAQLAIEAIRARGK